MTAACVNVTPAEARDGDELEFLRLYLLMTRDQQQAVAGMLINMCSSTPAARPNTGEKP